MKSFKRILFLFLGLLSGLVSAQGIEFEDISMESALKKAKAENKIVFIDGYATWCGPCKKMEKTVFKEQEVGALFRENLVAVKVDVERGEGPAIKEKYGIQGLPGYVFIDGDDHVVYRFSAAMPKDEFIAEVQKALEFAGDPLSIGRLAERYDEEKNDETFVRTYLEKLKESKATGYTDVLEHYLKIQNDIDENSGEMVHLLADHHAVIINGGEADRIIEENLYSDEWNKYVRKDIREIYQKLPKAMIRETTNYAISKRDTTLLELALKEAAAIGASSGKEQRKRLYTHYYLETGQGEKYKELTKPEIEEYIAPINVEELREFYIDWQKRRSEGDPEALRLQRPLAVKYSDGIKNLVVPYSDFVSSEEDKKDILRWMKIAYDLQPGDARTMGAYAKVLYMFGDKQTGLEIMMKSHAIAEQNNLKITSGLKKDLDNMQAGKSVRLN